MKYNSNVIIACDFKDEESLWNFLKKMKNEKLFLKLGMQILYSSGFEIISKLKKMGHNIFVDLKIFDIPNTSKEAIKSLSKYKPDFISVHSMNSLEALKEMQTVASQHHIHLLGVTLLTSMNMNDLKNLNINISVKNEIEFLLQNIRTAKLYGAISSAQESDLVRQFGLKSFTPGIRILNTKSDDQKRIVTPKQAIINGSDFVILGRSIIKAVDPLKTYKKVINEVEEAAK